MSAARRDGSDAEIRGEPEFEDGEHRRSGGIFVERRFESGRYGGGAERGAWRGHGFGREESRDDGPPGRVERTDAVPGGGRESHPDSRNERAGRRRQNRGD